MLEMRKKEIEGLMQQTSVKSQGQEQEIAGLLAKLEEAKTERISLNQIISELKNKNQELTQKAGVLQVQGQPEVKGAKLLEAESLIEQLKA